MADVDLRRLEREAAQGDPRARARLLRERLKRGLIDEDRLALAAYLGDATAVALRPHEAVEPDPDGAGPFIDGLSRWGRKVVVLALYALSQAQDTMPGDRQITLVIPYTSATLLSFNRSLTLGRAPQCDIRLADPLVSREHCRVSLDSTGRILAEDLHSSNGTWLGTQPLPPGQATILQPGDRLSVGRFALELRASSAPGPARDCLEAITAWLDDPSNELLPAIAGAEAMLAAVAPPAAPLELELPLVAARAVLVDPPGTHGRPLLGLSDFVQTVRRALLPLALGPEPLPVCDDPPAETARGPLDAWQSIATGAARELGVRIQRPLGEDLLHVIEARDPAGARSRLLVMLEREQSSDPFCASPWARWEAVVATDLSRLAHPALERPIACAASPGVRFVQLADTPGRALTEEAPETTAGRVALISELCAPADLVAAHLPGEIPITPELVTVGPQGPVLHGVQAFLSGDAGFDMRYGEARHLRRLSFASPDELEGSRNHACALVYRLGGILHWLLTGDPPNGRQAARVIPFLASDRPVPPVTQLGATVSAALEAVSARALEKDPRTRYPNPLAFAEALAETPEGRGDGAER